MLSHLDPRAPLVFNIRDLSRRAGSIKRLSVSLPAPADLGTDVIRVPEGSDLELSMRFESVVEGVLVSGTARARLAGECVRCLDAIDDELDVDFQELFVYPDEDADDEAERLVGDLLDLEPAVRDAVVLALPLQPVCQDDCPGLCSECGARLAGDPAHHHDAADSRWAALASLLGGPADGAEDPTSGAPGAATNQES